MQKTVPVTRFLSAISFAAIFAIVLLAGLAYYNQPTGDDFWFTWVANKYGFWGALKHWFVTINGRFSSNALMSLNSLRWGSTIFFQFGPVLLMLGYCLAFSRLFRLVLLPGLSWGQCVLLAIIAYSSICYSLPGLYEGVFWMSAVAGYQVPILLALFLVPNVLSRESKKISASDSLLLVAAFVISGFHELVAMELAMLSAMMIILNRVSNKGWSAIWLSILIVAAMALMVQVVSKGNLEKAASAGSMRITGTYNLLSTSTLQFGYHLAKSVLLSPAVMCSLVIIAILSHGKTGDRVAQMNKITFVSFSLAILLLSVAPVIVVAQIEQYKAPMRVLNFSILLFFVWLMVMAVWVGNRYAQIIGFQNFLAIGRKPAGQIIVFVLLYVSGILWKGKQVFMPLADGSAAIYRQEVNARIITCQKASLDTVTLYCLTRQPSVLCPVDICNDKTIASHMEKIFNKKILMR